MDPAIQEFIQGKRIAVVGVSRDSKKFGCMAAKELKQRGYQTFAVNPQLKEYEGEPCYPDLSALSGKVDSVLVTVSAKNTVQVLRDAAAAGIRNVWLQQGINSSEAKAVGRELGLNVVSGKCILMYATPVRSFHAWHRGFMKLIGQL